MNSSKELFDYGVDVQRGKEGFFKKKKKKKKKDVMSYLSLGVKDHYDLKNINRGLVS